MPQVDLTFPHELNVSVQIGDIAYYAVTNPVGPSITWAAGTTPHWQAGQGDIIMIGPIIGIQQWDNGPADPDPQWGVPPVVVTTDSVLVCDMAQSLINIYGLPPVGAFIMFSKDNRANLSSVLGYYASVKLVNDSQDEAELFSVGSNIFESSK